MNEPSTSFRFRIKVESYRFIEVSGLMHRGKSACSTTSWARSALMTLSRHCERVSSARDQTLQGTGARDPCRRWRPHITLQPDLALAGWWPSPYLGRKGAIPGERDWTPVARLRRSWGPASDAKQGGPDIVPGPP